MRNRAYDVINKTLCDMLAHGVTPWAKPWVGGQSGHPRNLESNRRYSGGNLWVLIATSWARGFTSPYWLTGKQAQKLGGYVRVMEGKKSTSIFYLKFDHTKNIDQLADDGSVETVQQKRPFAVPYQVYNLDQTRDVRLPKHAQAAPAPNLFTPIEEAERISREMPDPPTIRHEDRGACYSPTRDLIVMPHHEQFKRTTAYYGTLFHELGHSTGHQKRLDRKTITDIAPFGTQTYAAEELVAEITASYLCGVAGIENELEQSAAYLQGWMKRLQADPGLFVSAASKAQKAADFILGLKADDTAHVDTEANLQTA